jgi:hypothetical protein
MHTFHRPERSIPCRQNGWSWSGVMNRPPLSRSFPLWPLTRTPFTSGQANTIQFFSISTSFGRNELKRLIHLSHIPSPILHTPLPLYIPRCRSSSTFHNSLSTTHHLLALDRRHSSRQSRHLTTRFDRSHHLLPCPPILVNPVTIGCTHDLLLSWSRHLV